MVTAGDFRNGMTIQMDGSIWQVIEFQHVKPGKGSPFVRTKLKNIINGGVIDKSEYQYLYADDDFYHFMNTENYEQIQLTKETVGDSLKFVKENEMVKLLSHNGDVFAIEPPLFVELVITESEPGVKGNTATGATKPAIVETGAKVMVPLFVEQGEKIKIDTRTGENLSRA